MAEIDARLGGGLPTNRLHTLHAPDDGDWTAALALSLILARQAQSRLPLIWVAEARARRLGGQPYAPGLIELGLAPRAILHVAASDRLSALRAGLDCIRSGAAGSVVIGLWGDAALPDLLASRRLALAAEQTGTLALLVQAGCSASASAAFSRWEVAAAPSAALEAGAPGHSTFDLRLVRHRGGVAGFAARLEWDRDQHRFRDQALSGALVPIAFNRPAASERLRA
jgi:protein ImuA